MRVESISLQDGALAEMRGAPKSVGFWPCGLSSLMKCVRCYFCISVVDGPSQTFTLGPYIETTESLDTRVNNGYRA